MNRSTTRQPRPQPRQNLKDEVASFLRDGILSGDLRPGTKIDQDAIAEEMGVSKLPVREALIALAAEGMVDNVPRRGSFVAQLSPEDVRDHYAIYGLVSGLAAERATSAITDEQLQELNDLLERMAETKDPAQLGELNFAFHQAINVLGASKRLRSELRVLSQSLPTKFFEVTQHWPERAGHDHREIIDALADRDAERVGLLMNEHLRSSGDYAVRMLRDAGYWDSEADTDLEPATPGSTAR